MRTKRFDIWQFLSYCFIAVFVVGFASLAFGQLPLQPGDTPAPVADDPLTISEHNELVAKIDGPTKVSAGSLVMFDVTGSSDEDQELEFRPNIIPDKVIAFIPGGKYVCAYVAKPGHYTVVWSVENGHASAVVLWKLEVTGEPPDDDPPDIGLTETRVKKWLTDVPDTARQEVIANPITGAEFSRQRAVSKTFLQVSEVTAQLGSVRASKIMLETGLKAAYGPKVKEWETFNNHAMGYLDDVEEVADYGKSLMFIGDVLDD